MFLTFLSVYKHLPIYPLPHDLTPITSKLILVAHPPSLGEREFPGENMCRTSRGGGISMNVTKYIGVFGHVCWSLLLRRCWTVFSLEICCHWLGSQVSQVAKVARTKTWFSENRKIYFTVMSCQTPQKACENKRKQMSLQSYEEYIF